MDQAIKELIDLLRQAPARRLRKTLVRCVELKSLIESGKPDFLFTSGKRDRYNLAGVDCIYFAEDEETARAEHRCQAPKNSVQPVCIFFADVSLKVLDLADGVVRKILGFTEKDLRVPWERLRRPTRAQLLGTAVSNQRSFGGIRYPSDAARAHGFNGKNVVIFRACIRRSSFVRVSGPGKNVLQKWP